MQNLEDKATEVPGEKKKGVSLSASITISFPYRVKEP